MTTYKDAISREEALKIIKNWEEITYNCDTIEESFDMIADNVKALPSLQDQVVELIEKKIEGLYLSEGFSENYLAGKVSSLQELLEEIKLLTN